MEEVSSWYVKERDPYYIIGRAEGVTLERTRSQLSIAHKMKEERTRSILSMARKMLEAGLSIPQIITLTDLTEEQILNIKPRKHNASP